MQAHSDCVQSAIARLDDGQSDARTIAIAATAECRVEQGAVADVFAQGKSPYVRQLLYERFVEQEADIATSLVLEYRRAQ